jgi:hypothetical protein
MARRLLVIVAAAAALALPAAPAGAHNGGFTACGDSDTAGWYDLQARDVACRVARKVADHYILIAHAEDDGYKGWRCANTQDADNPLRTACRRTKDGKHQKIKFEFAG